MHFLSNHFALFFITLVRIKDYSIALNKGICDGLTMVYVLWYALTPCCRSGIITQIIYNFSLSFVILNANIELEKCMLLQECL